MEVESNPPDSTAKLHHEASKSKEAWLSQDIASISRLNWVIAVCLFSVFVAGAICSTQRRNANPELLGALGSYLCGACFAAMMMAAIWPALGAGRYRDRFAFAIIWNGVLFVATMITMAIYAGPSAPEAAFELALMLTAVWLLPQAPLWAIRFFVGARFDIPGRTNVGTVNQFGIGHLLIFTSVIAVILGASRAALSLFRYDMREDLESMLSFGFIIGCAAILSLPLLAAALIERYVFLSVLIVLALVGLVGYWQHTLLGLITNMQFGPPRAFFIGQSASMAAWILIFAFTLRMNGYRIVRSAP